MQLSLYLPNFRDEITVEEIDKLTDVAEELKFESIWTLDRIVVPEKSDRGELEKPFGMMSEFPINYLYPQKAIGFRVCR